MRRNNPNDEINFIYDSKLLSEHAQNELIKYCKRYKITPKDLRKDIFPYCESTSEKNLIQLYEHEIKHLQNGGNLGSASDLLRWLKPVYTLGTYSDFDTTINTHALPETIEVNSPLLLNIGSQLSTSILFKVESPALNNDTIAVVDYKAAETQIQKIQASIVTAMYVKENEKNPFQVQLVKIQQDVANAFGQAAAFIFLALPQVPILQTLAKIHETLKKPVSNLALRQTIIHQTSNLNRFLNLLEIPQENVQIFAQDLRKALKKLPSPALKPILLKRNDQEFLTEYMKFFQTILLRDSVVYSSGPGKLLQGLSFKWFYSVNEFNQTVPDYGFAHYNQLGKAFHSENHFPFHATSKELRALQSKDFGEVGDISWLEVGIQKVAGREEKFLKDLQDLPHQILLMQLNINAHIMKIQGDLHGYFGWYRKEQRQEKIKALTNIEKHFENQKQFKVHEVLDSLKDYETKAVSASIGRSKTKKLINDLKFFSHRAIDLLAVNEDDKVALNL